MSGISTILWDVGGVLLTNGWDQQQRDSVLARFGLNRTDFDPRHAEVFDAWERDEIGVDEYLRHTVFFEPRSFTKIQFLEAMQGESRLLPDSALGILRQLAHQPLRTDRNLRRIFQLVLSRCAEARPQDLSGGARCPAEGSGRLRFYRRPGGERGGGSFPGDSRDSVRGFGKAERSAGASGA
jgi:hypothetical protein